VSVRALAATAVSTFLLSAPSHRVLVPGVSLGGLRLGATPAQVRAAWGSRYGACRGCAAPTWYFTYRPFTQQGAGVEFRQGRAAALFTLWEPTGWRTPGGLSLGEPAARVTQLYGPLPRLQCVGYAALTLPRAGSLTVFYLVDERLWGFALMRAGHQPCL